MIQLSTKSYKSKRKEMTKTIQTLLDHIEEHESEMFMDNEKDLVNLARGYLKSGVELGVIIAGSEEKESLNLISSFLAYVHQVQNLCGSIGMRKIGRDYQLQVGGKRVD